MGDVQYPWEAEEEQVRAEQARRLEEAVESSWKDPKQSQKEQIDRYGLEIWVYFQVLRCLTAVFFILSVLAFPKLAYVAQGSGIHQRDPLAWLARISLGNASLEAVLKIGPVDVRLHGSAVLPVIDALQWMILLGFLVWFRFWWMTQIMGDQELRGLSAADYAVQVDWLPPRTAEHQQYEWDLIRHFEALLRELDGCDPHALVCQAALMRDFGDGLLVAQERRRLQENITSLADLPRTPGRLWRVNPEERISKLKARVEVLTHRMRSCRADEAERPVRRAYVILATQAERARLLQEYRFSKLPVIGGYLQASKLRFGGKWPLKLTAAPDPGDIIWEHFGVSPRTRVIHQGVTALFVILVFAQTTALAWFAWWGLLGMRGRASAQCTLADPSPVFLADAGAVPCLLPPLKDPLDSDLVWTPQERGCDCFCAPEHRWWTSAEECYTLGSLKAWMAAVAFVFIVECLHWLLTFSLPMLVRRWRPICKADAELAILKVLVCTVSIAPFAVSVGHLVFKMLLDLEPAAEFSEALTWEVDQGWYLHCAPIVVLWCLFRWLGPVLHALGFCCRILRRARVLRLRERYASLAAVVAVSVALQPLLPSLVPLAALGLLLRHQSEKYLFLRGGLDPQPTATLRTALQVTHVALVCMWLAVAAGSVLSIWVLGHPVVSGKAMGEPHDFMARAVSTTAMPALVVLCISVGAPLIAWLWFAVTWLCGFHGSGHQPQPSSKNKSAKSTGSAVASSLGFQEAWLRMIHTDLLATYQLHEQPGYKNGAVLEELQPEAGIERSVLQSVPSYLSRGADLNSSIAAVGAHAPSRSSGKKTAASELIANATPAMKVPKPPPEGTDIFSQLMQAPAAPSALAAARVGSEEGQPALCPVTLGAWSGQTVD